MRQHPPSSYRHTRSFSLLTWLTISLAVASPAVAQAATEEQILMGEWRNETEGHLMGIHLDDGENCTLYVERFLQPRTIRDCRYEKYSSRYMVYLKDAQGECDCEPDFEFTFHEHEPLVRFYVGGSEIVMHRQANR